MTGKEKYEANTKWCHEQDLPQFVPPTNRCFSCRKEIFQDDETGKGPDVHDFVTSCPYCCRTFCDQEGSMDNPKIQYPVVVVVETIKEQDLGNGKIGVDVNIYLYNIYPDYDTAVKALIMVGLKQDLFGVWYSSDDCEDRYIIGYKPGTCLTSVCYEERYEDNINRLTTDSEKGD